MLSKEEIEEIKKRAAETAHICFFDPPEIVELTEEDKKRIREQIEKDKEEVKKWKEEGRKYILKRNEVRSYTKEQLGWKVDKDLDIYEEKVIEKAFEKVEPIQQPLRTTIEWPYGSVNAQTVVRFIKNQNEKRGYYLKQEFKAYLRPAKKLIDTYGQEAVKNALIIAAKNAKDYVNGTNNYITLKYVEGILSRQHNKNMK